MKNQFYVIFDIYIYARIDRVTSYNENRKVGFISKFREGIKETLL